MVKIKDFFTACLMVLVVVIPLMHGIMSLEETNLNKNIQTIVNKK